MVLRIRAQMTLNRFFTRYHYTLIRNCLPNSKKPFRTAPFQPDRQRTVFRIRNKSILVLRIRVQITLIDYSTGLLYILPKYITLRIRNKPILVLRIRAQTILIEYLNRVNYTSQYRYGMAQRICNIPKLVLRIRAHNFFTNQHGIRLEFWRKSFFWIINLRLKHFTLSNLTTFYYIQPYNILLRIRSKPIRVLRIRAQTILIDHFIRLDHKNHLQFYYFRLERYRMAQRILNKPKLVLRIRALIVSIKSYGIGSKYKENSLQITDNVSSNNHIVLYPNTSTGTNTDFHIPEDFILTLSRIIIRLITPNNTLFNLLPNSYRMSGDPE